MTDAPTFTAEQVREMRFFIQSAILRDRTGHMRVQDEGDGYALQAMLDAFAQRLEQEASDVAGQLYLADQKAAEALREEGRREVLREIAAVFPCAIDEMCPVCHHVQPNFAVHETHEHKWHERPVSG